MKRSRTKSAAVINDVMNPPSDGDTARLWRQTDDEGTSVDEVYNAILLRIINGSYSGGTILTSTRLARELNVSRTPVVSALDRLVTDGILEKEKNKRAIVRRGAEEWLLQVHQLREMLEPLAASLAAVNMAPTSLEKLDRLARAAEPGKSDNWIRAAREFDYSLHLAIADHCGNLPLRKTIYKCWSYKRLSYEAGHDDPRNLEIGYREHLAILQALKRRDTQTASAAMLFHLRSASYLTADRGIV